jgi:hypothetical protein
MRTRIIASLAGTSIGLLAGTYIGADLGFSGTIQYVAFGVAGLLLGNAVSLLVDVFSGNTGAAHQQTGKKPGLTNPAGTHGPQ